MRLFLKLFLSHLLVALLALALLLLLAEAFAPAFYRGHVERMYHALAMMGGGMMAEALRQDLEKGLRSTLTAALLSALPLSALGALLTALFASLRLYRTARLLAEGSRRMAQGEYGIRLPLLERDELGELALHFNRLAEALEKVERTRAELIGTVAHELRTPLAALQGYAEGLMDGVLSKEKAAEGILREVKALGRLVEDLSLVSRVEAKAVEIRPRPLDPKGLLEEAFTRFQSAFQAKGWRFAWRRRRGFPRCGPMRKGSSRCWPTSSPTPSATRPQAARCALGPSARGRLWPSRWRTPDPASPRSTCPTSLSASTGWTRPAAARREEAGWGSPSPRAWWRPWGEGSSWKAKWAREVVSPSPFPFTRA